MPRHCRQVVIELALEVMGRDVAFVALEELVDVGRQRLERAGVARAVHGEEFRVQMIDAIAFKHQTRTANTRQRAIDQQGDLFRRNHQPRQHFVRLGKRVAAMVLPGHHHGKTRGIGANGVKGDVAFILPNQVHRRLAGEHCAKNNPCAVNLPGDG